MVKLNDEINPKTVTSIINKRNLWHYRCEEQQTHRLKTKERKSSKSNRRYIKWLYCYIIMIIIITHYSKNTHLYRKKEMIQNQTLQTRKYPTVHDHQAAACCFGGEN